MCATDHALNVDENRSIHASSLAGVDSIGAASAVPARAAGEVLTSIGRKVTVVKSSNSSITHQKVRRLVDGSSVDGLASLDRVVTVD